MKPCTLKVKDYNKLYLTIFHFSLHSVKRPVLNSRLPPQTNKLWVGCVSVFDIVARSIFYKNTALMLLWEGWPFSKVLLENSRAFYFQTFVFLGCRSNPYYSMKITLKWIKFNYFIETIVFAKRFSWYDRQLFCQFGHFPLTIRMLDSRNLSVFLFRVHCWRGKIVNKIFLVNFSFFTEFCLLKFPAHTFCHHG